MIVKLTACFEIDDDNKEFFDDFKGTVENHFDHFADLDGYPELKSVYGVKLTEVTE